MPGMQTINTVSSFVRMSTDTTIGDVDLTLVSNIEAQRYTFAITRTEANAAMAENRFFETPIQAEWTWRANPYYVWVASSVTEGSVTFKWD